MRNIFAFLTNNNNESILAFEADEVLECNDSNCLEKAAEFIEKHENDYRFGFFSYDLKNEVEDLKSQNPDRIQFPLVGFFVPKYVVQWDENGNQTFLKGEADQKALDFIEQFLSQKEVQPNNKVKLISGLSKKEYISTIEKLQEEIQYGNIYEVTFCQEFYAEKSRIEPLSTYFALNRATKATFSCFLEWEGRYLISASPERFLKREGNRLITQPIKGTAKRGATPEEDVQLKSELLASEKERAENVMIVDLVRNDLSRIAERNSVQVDELFGVYTFETVHQLISTVSATIDDWITGPTDDIIANEDSTPQKGSETDPFTVHEAKNNLGKKQVWVKGYIVGYYSSSSLASFVNNSGELASTTNLAIAFSSTETDKAMTFPIQLSSPTLTSIRNIINLKDNPLNFQKEVLLKGDIETYYGTIGLKTVKGAIIDGIRYP